MEKRDKNGKHRKFIGKETVIDGSTGEVLKESYKFKESITKTHYVVMYLDDDNLYESLSGLGNQGKVFGYILKHYDARTSMFNFSAYQKHCMKEETGLSEGTVRSSVYDFCKSDLMVRVMGADYMVNPRRFYKGQLSNRDALISFYDKVKDRKEKGK